MADRGATPERGCVERDREILCVFFKATNKAKAGQLAAGPFQEEIRQDGWKVKDGWVSSQPMAEWYGVTTDAEGRVIGLKLDSNDLAGVIPPRLGDLDALETLSLYTNRLEGGIPRELGKLRALRMLKVSWNRDLGGVIPHEMGDLNALEELLLERCGLEGGIPRELGKLRALRKLDVSVNWDLGGVIPYELGDLNALKQLRLIGCGLEGEIPPELGKLHALEKLYLSNNNLKGVMSCCSTGFETTSSPSWVSIRVYLVFLHSERFTCFTGHGVPLLVVLLPCVCAVLAQQYSKKMRRHRVF